MTAAGPVLYCGDPHGGVRGSLQYIIDAARQTNASAVIMLGDIEPVRPLHEELALILDRTWWIPGNHDSDSDEMWRRVATPQMAPRNLHGRVAKLPDGTRIAGLVVSSVNRSGIRLRGPPAVASRGFATDASTATPHHIRIVGTVATIDGTGAASTQTSSTACLSF